MLKKPLTSLSTKTIIVGARASELSKIQVKEVFALLYEYFPEIDYLERWVETIGDRDQITSLKSQEKTDFFTYELDQMVLSGELDIAVHSAKDLPDPLPKGLEIIALTKGVDPRDALVFASGYSLENLPKSARIGTSSVRREEYLKELSPFFEIVDIRGSVPDRLKLLQEGALDALVVAEAALIRLGLTQLPRILLDGPVAPLQGRLAVIARKERVDLKELFSPIDAKDIALGTEC